MRLAYPTPVRLTSQGRILVVDECDECDECDVAAGEKDWVVTTLHESKDVQAASASEGEFCTLYSLPYCSVRDFHHARILFPTIVSH